MRYNAWLHARNRKHSQQHPPRQVRCLNSSLDSTFGRKSQVTCMLNHSCGQAWNNARNLMRGKLALFELIPANDVVQHPSFVHEDTACTDESLENFCACCVKTLCTLCEPLTVRLCFCKTFNKLAIDDDARVRAVGDARCLVSSRRPCWPFHKTTVCSVVSPNN